ncbi:MAG: hypothetical protein U0797_30385 [Gemmataceae bacterium]
MSATEEAPKANPEGREANGRFARGNRGGPGNPYARQVAAFKCRVLHRVKDDDLDAIIDKLVELARQGDVAAARLVLQHTLGKPIESAHPDRLDRDEVEAFKANRMCQDAFGLVESAPVEPVLVAVRELSPARGQEFMTGLLAGLRAQDEAAAKGGPAADTKRPNRPRSAPASVPADVAFAEAETLRLINQPGGADGQADRRAANPRQP